MKKFVLLFIFFCFSGNAQITQEEFNTAMQALNEGTQAQAIKNVESLEKKYPASNEVLFLRSMYKYRDGDMNGALIGFSNVIKADAEFTGAFQTRALIYATKGMYEKAIADQTQAIKLEPGNIMNLIDRIKYYLANKQYKEAFEDSKIRIARDPDASNSYLDAANISKQYDPNFNSEIFFVQSYANKKIKKCITDLMYGKFLILQDRFEESANKYHAAFLACPEEFTAHDYESIGLAYYKTRKYDVAIPYFKKAIEMQPKNLAYWNYLASVYLAQRDWPKLKEVALRNLAQDENDAWSNSYYAHALLNTGQEKLALEYNEKAMRLSKEAKALE